MSDECLRIFAANYGGGSEKNEQLQIQLEEARRGKKRRPLAVCSLQFTVSGAQFSVCTVCTVFSLYSLQLWTS